MLSCLLALLAGCEAVPAPDERAAPSERGPAAQATSAVDGEAHRVLLLLPSQGGTASVARYRVAIADAPDVELVVWLTLEEHALERSDGVEFAVGVGDGGDDPATMPLRFQRLTPEQAASGWRELRIDLSPWRGRTVWLALASREPGDRGSDWLLWGDPRVVVAEPAPLHVDLRTPEPSRSRRLDGVPWSEANVFKAYSGFNEDRAASLDPGCVERSFPWLGALRLFASLGASWGPTLARDYEAQMGHNPTRDSREERRWAEHYEFFHDGPGWESDLQQYPPELEMLLGRINACLVPDLRRDFETTEVRESVEACPIEVQLQRDPTEGVHASDILPLTYRYFEVIVPPRLRRYDRSAAFQPHPAQLAARERPKDQTIAQLIVLLEHELLRAGVIPTHNTIVVARPRSVPLDPLSPAEVDRIAYADWAESKSARR